MIRRRGRAGNSNVLIPLRGKLEEIPDRGSSWPVPRVGQPGSGVTPAKNLAGGTVRTRRQATRPPQRRLRPGAEPQPPSRRDLREWHGERAQRGVAVPR